MCCAAHSSGAACAGSCGQAPCGQAPCGHAPALQACMAATCCICTTCMLHVTAFLRQELKVCLMQGTNCGCTSSLLKALAAQGSDNPTADALGIVDIDSEFDGNLGQLASEAAAAQCPKGFTHRQGEFAARHAFTSMSTTAARHPTHQQQKR